MGLLASFGLFTLAFARISGRRELAPVTRRVVRVMAGVSALTTAVMVPHLLAPLSADSIADGQSSTVSVFMTIGETLVNAPWALGVALLALVAGALGDLGNGVIAIVGVVGGVSFAAAAVTIPFTDALDGLFPVAEWASRSGPSAWSSWVLGDGARPVCRPPRRSQRCEQEEPRDSKGATTARTGARLRARRTSRRHVVAGS